MFFMQVTFCLLSVYFIINFIIMIIDAVIIKIINITVTFSLFYFPRTQKARQVLHERQVSGRFSQYKEDFLSKPEMIRYIEKCCRYAWKLICQTPPYILQGNSDIKRSKIPFNDNYHQISKDCSFSESNSGNISFVVWPGLFDGSSGRPIRKTEVVLQ